VGEEIKERAAEPGADASGWRWRHAFTGLGLAGVLAGAAILGWWVARVTAARPAAVVVDAAAPLSADEQSALLASFRLPTLDGQELGPPDFRGRVVLLEFWATWCGPCRAQSRILTGLLEEYTQAGVTVLGVNVAEPDELVETFLADQPAEWPTVLDREAALSTSLEVFGLPTVIVLDGEGRVAYRSSGLTGTRALRTAIDEALGAAAAPAGTG
jgi:thiol-disulfide isomerase/thioredoxin